MLVWFVSVYAIFCLQYSIFQYLLLWSSSPLGCCCCWAHQTAQHQPQQHRQKSAASWGYVCCLHIHPLILQMLSLLLLLIPTDDAAGFGDFALALVVTVLGPVCASQWLMSVANALNSVKCITILPCCCYTATASASATVAIEPPLSHSPSLCSLCSLQAKHRNSFTPIAALACVWLIDGRIVCSFPFVLLLFLL